LDRYAATICLPLIVDTYPIVLDHRSESLSMELHLHDLSGRGGMARARVLVADDNQSMRGILTSTLADEFDVIRAVSDGGAALVAATQLLPDVAILDIFMPVLKWDRSGATNKGRKDQCNRKFSSPHAQILIRFMQPARPGVSRMSLSCASAVTLSEPSILH